MSLPHASRELIRIPTKLRAPLVYIAGAFVLMYPWLGFGYLFAADEYLHVYNACILDNLLFGEDSRGYSDWFTLNPWPEPNLAGHALLLGLSRMMPAAWAEKLIVLALAAGIGLAFLRASDPLRLGAAAAGRGPVEAYWRAALGLLALTFVFGAVLRFGFVNYLLGIVGSLAALTLTAERTGGSRWSVAGYAMLLYFCHPIALLFFFGAFTLRELLRLSTESPTRLPGSGDLSLLLANSVRWFALPLGLLVAYVLRQTEQPSLGTGSLRRLGAMVLGYRDLILFDPSEAGYAVVALVAAALAGVCGIVWLLAARGGRGVLALAGLLVLLTVMVAVPDVLSGGAYIAQRLRPFAFIWVLWSAAHAAGRASSHLPRGAASSAARLQLRPALTAGMLAAAVTVAIWLSAVRTPAVAAIAAEFDELRAFAELIPDGSVVLPAAPPQMVDGREDLASPFHHFAGVIGCERGIVLLDNYEASVGDFPLVWREGRDPFAAMTRGAEAHPVSIPVAGKDYFDRYVNYVLTRGTLDFAIHPATAEWMRDRVRFVDSSERGAYSLYAVARPEAYIMPRSR